MHTSPPPSQTTPGRQPLIALFGVDGCGKTTVIEALQPLLLERVKGVEVIHSASKPRASAAISNHARPPHPTPLCWLKFLRRAIRWRQQYRNYYRPRLESGCIVLSDRFYFDDIWIDPLKYRYAGPIKPLCWLRARVPGPDVYLLLDAPEAVLYARKQETTLEEVARLRRAYQELLTGQPRAHSLDASAPCDEVIEHAYRIIVDYIQSIELTPRQVSSARVVVKNTG